MQNLNGSQLNFLEGLSKDTIEAWGGEILEVASDFVERKDYYGMPQSEVDKWQIVANSGSKEIAIINLKALKLHY